MRVEQIIGNIMVISGVIILVVMLGTTYLDVEIPDIPDIPLPTIEPTPTPPPSPYPDTPPLGKWYDVEIGTECTKFCVDKGMTPSCAICPNANDHTGAVFADYDKGSACTSITIGDKWYCTAGVADEIWELYADPWFTRQLCACVEV